MAALLVATTVMAYVGMLGILGGIRFVRCDHCGHLGLTSTLEPLRSCTYCRHGRLLHPLASLHHAHAAHIGGIERDQGAEWFGDTQPPPRIVCNTAAPERSRSLAAVSNTTSEAPAR